MHEGYSWSGHERNCGYLNLGDGRFVDISAAAGLDFLDDGRSLAVCDWDADGDLDLWLKNRTGPQLRFLRNNAFPDHHFIAFKLTGRTCNRDAIGAKIMVESGDRRWVRTLLAGDGYLAQSSKWLHFGLGNRDAVDRITITWPDRSVQTIPPPPVDRRYHIVQDVGRSHVASQPTVFHTPAPARSVTLDRHPADRPDATPPARLVLKVPLPLPPTLIPDLFGEASGAGRPRLINLWAQWCAPCRAELIRFSKNYKRLFSAGFDILALNLDKEADQAKAREFFRSTLQPLMNDPMLEQRPATKHELDILDAILRHVRDNQADWPLPTSLLCNPNGTLQVVYLGPVSVDQLLRDVTELGLNAPPLHRRGSFPGRWYFRTPRNLPALSQDLRERGLRIEARFYAILDRAVRKQG